MAAPQFVPRPPSEPSHAYQSPPRRPDSWRAERPGDITHQPDGPAFGHQGPDQGYALALVHALTSDLRLAGGVEVDDAIAGCLGVALKRASIFGRAPVIHDWRVAFTVWGFLDGDAPSELVELRRSLFTAVANPHHYLEARRIVDLVPEDTLRRTPAQVTEGYVADWRSLLASP